MQHWPASQRAFHSSRSLARLLDRIVWHTASERNGINHRNETKIRRKYVDILAVSVLKYTGWSSTESVPNSDDRGSKT